MENIDDEKKKKKLKEWVLKTFGCDGLEPHNRSLEFMCEVLDDVGATIDVGGESRQYDAESFAIRVPGSSGVPYRISVHFRPRAARLMEQRLNEIDFGEDGAIGTLMHAFRQMMDFQIHWHDLRDGDWETICIHDRRDKTPDCWPGDHVVATVMLLADDLRSALELPMNTLRRELRESYPVAWAAGLTPSDVTFADVVKYVAYLEELQNAENRDEFLEIRARTLKDLYNEEE